METHARIFIKAIMVNIFDKLIRGGFPQIGIIIKHKTIETP